MPGEMVARMKKSSGIQKIIAIGGGNLGFGAAKPEVTSISREILRLSGKKNPRLLFIPTASLDEKGYIRAVQGHFGTKLGCGVEVLLLHGKNPGFPEIRRAIFGTDILYVGGGNTLRMMNLWKKLGVDRLLREAHDAGKVLCGSSAGAICWFRQGNSDSRKFRNPDAKLIKVTGLGFLDTLACPHYDVEKDRKPELKEMMKKTRGVAVALDNCAALEVVGDKYRALASKPQAGAYKVYWAGGRYFEEKQPVGLWRPLPELFKKAVATVR